MIGRIELPPIRPLGVGDVFDEAFDLYKQNFTLFVTIVVVTQLPVVLALNVLTYHFPLDQPGFRRSARGDGEMLGFALGFIAVFVVWVIVYLFQSAALTVAVSDRYFGVATSLRSAYRRARPAMWRLIGAWMLAAFVISAVTFGALFAAAFVWSAVAAAAGPGSTNDVTAVVFLASIGVVIVVLIPLIVALGAFVLFGMFVIQTIVVERIGAASAVRRNMELVSGRFRRLAAALLVLVFIVSALTLTVQQSVVFLLNLFIYPWLEPSRLVRYCVEAVWRGITSIVVEPFTMICLTLLYYDLRVRKEGFDLALLERRLYPAATPEAAP